MSRSQWMLDDALDRFPSLSAVIHLQWIDAGSDSYRIDHKIFEKTLRDIIGEVERCKMTSSDAVLLFKETIRSFTHEEFPSDGDN